MHLLKCESAVLNRGKFRYFKGELFMKKLFIQSSRIIIIDSKNKIENILSHLVNPFQFLWHILALRRLV